MTYSQWLNTCAVYAGSDWGYMQKWYSFRAAYDEGMTPAQAVTDCNRWLYEHTVKTTA